MIQAVAHNDKRFISLNGLDQVVLQGLEQFPGRLIA